MNFGRAFVHSIHFHSAFSAEKIGKVSANNHKAKRKQAEDEGVFFGFRNRRRMHPNAQSAAESVVAKVADDVGFVSDVGIAGAKVADGSVDQAGADPVDSWTISAVGEIAAAANARAKPVIAPRLLV